MSRFDLTANPSMEERKRLAAADYVIAALPTDDQLALHGVVVFPQIIVGTQAVVAVCQHRHSNRDLALSCANELANALRQPES